MKHWFMEFYPYLGWAGSLTILVCSLVAAAAYRGKEGERYSIGRHFVSELGELGVSRLARVFNRGLIIGSFLFLLMMPGVGMSLGSVWGYIGTAAGMIAALGCFFVGIFPMNFMKQHAAAAMTYFRAGLATVILFSIAIVLQPAEARVIPLYSLIISGLAMVAYTSFLIRAGNFGKKYQQSNALDTSEMKVRPRFWWMPFLEWMVVIFTILWFLVICAVR